MYCRVILDPEILALHSRQQGVELSAMEQLVIDRTHMGQETVIGTCLDIFAKGSQLYGELVEPLDELGVRKALQIDTHSVSTFAHRNASSPIRRCSAARIVPPLSPEALMSRFAAKNSSAAIHLSETS